MNIKECMDAVNEKLGDARSELDTVKLAVGKTTAEMDGVAAEAALLDKRREEVESKEKALSRSIDFGRRCEEACETVIEAFESMQQCVAVMHSAEAAAEDASRVEAVGRPADVVDEKLKRKKATEEAATKARDEFPVLQAAAKDAITERTSAHENFHNANEMPLIEEQLAALKEHCDKIEARLGQQQQEVEEARAQVEEKKHKLEALISALSGSDREVEGEQTKHGIFSVKGAADSDEQPSTPQP